MSYEKVRLLVHLKDLEVLVETVHHRAGIHAGKAVEEIEAAFYASLHQSSRELAGVVGHVVGSDVDGTCSRRPQTDGEAVAYVKEHLWNVIAGVTYGQAAVSLGLFHQLVVSILKQVLKVDQML